MKLSQVIFIALAAACVFVPSVNSGMALISGILLGLFLGNPFSAKTKKLTPLLLQISVVGMGAGMSLDVIARVGLQGIGYTAIGITLTLVLGTWIGKWLNGDPTTSLLVSTGTAICGGSAIAAVSPVVRAKDHEVSVALATVFFLNAAALFIFPWIGHRVGLNEQQFGLWAALAIHDTSSVVGASMQYGTHALEVATTVKLARALWIIPVTLGISALYSRRANQGSDLNKMKKPWFILGFLAAAALVTWIPSLQGVGHLVANGAKRSLVLTLFLIGCGLSRATLKSVGFRPFLQGLLLWLVVGSATLGAIELGLIQ